MSCARNKGHEEGPSRCGRSGLIPASVIRSRSSAIMSPTSATRARYCSPRSASAACGIRRWLMESSWAPSS